MNQFTETRNRFASSTNCTYPLSYENWKSLDRNLKAAALFVNFFDTITLAWRKAKSDFTPDEDGVSIVMQYLIKNIDIIECNSNGYAPNYIYRVAYNCMGCLRRTKRDKDAHEKNTSNIVMCGEDELDLFDTVSTETDPLLEVSCNNLWEFIWNLMAAEGVESAEIIEKLAGSRKKTKKNDASKTLDVLDRLNAGKIPRKADALIIGKLKENLREVAFMYGIKAADDHNLFSYVLRIDDKVASAVVEMPDGIQAVYYGETVDVKVDRKVKTGIVFEGPYDDYIIPMEDAKSLRVVDIEMY